MLHGECVCTKGNVSVQSMSLSDLNAFLFFLAFVLIDFFLSANAAFSRAFCTSKCCFFICVGSAYFLIRSGFFITVTDFQWNIDLD